MMKVTNIYKHEIVDKMVIEYIFFEVQITHTRESKLEGAFWG